MSCGAAAECTDVLPLHYCDFEKPWCLLSCLQDVNEVGGLSVSAIRVFIKSARKTPGFSHGDRSAAPCLGQGRSGFPLAFLPILCIMDVCIKCFRIGYTQRRNNFISLTRPLKSVAGSIIICWKAARQPM